MCARVRACVRACWQWVRQCLPFMFLVVLHSVTFPQCILNMDALHKIFHQGLNPCPSRQRTVSQSVLLLSSSCGLVTRLVSIIAITFIFGEMTMPCHLSESQTVSRYIFSQYFGVTYIQWHHSASFECCLAN